MTTPTAYLSATPVLASLDIERSVSFFESMLGFTRMHVEQGVYGVAVRDNVSIHFWACNDTHIAQATSCRIQVSGLHGLYEHCRSVSIVHPNAHLETKPWGSTEFAILDPDGNLVTFHETGA